MPFETFLKKGLLKRQNINYKQIEKQMIRARRDLDTAKHNLDYDSEWAGTIAYQGMLRAGRALIFSKGFLPADGQQHKTVVGITSSILGKEYSALVQKFENMRRNRNQFFYESDPFGTLTDARNSIKAAAELIGAIRNLIHKENPQQQMEI